MLSLYLFGLGLAFALGVYVGRRLERWYTPPAPLPMDPDKTAPRRRRKRMKRRHYSPPGVMPRLVTEAELVMRRQQWDTVLINFALKASLCNSLSERAVVGAGVVTVSDYRLCQDILRWAGVWIVPRTRARVRWSAGWTVGKLRRALRQGELAPPYPSAAPPSVDVLGTRG